MNVITLDERLRARVHRWRSILLCGVVGGTLSAALTGPMHRGWEWFVEALAPAPAIFVGVAAGIAIVVVLWPVDRERWRGMLGIWRFNYYPPLWLAALLGLVTWAVLVRWLGQGLPPAVRGTASLFLGWPARAAAMSVVVAAVSSSWAWLSAIDRRAYAFVEPPLDLAYVDFDWIVRWVRTDDAIERATEDRFGHRVVAGRIAQRVFEPDLSSTLALIGPKGSGKTTIGKLVEECLAPHNDVVFVRVSMWPFETPEAAVRGVIDAVVAGLSRRIDVWSLADVRRFRC